MKYHDHGYVSGDPRVRPAAGSGLSRTEDIPDTMDVLIVGSGPAGMVTAAQLSQFPDITTRIIERREGRLEFGQADGINSRSVETFQSFGFAERITKEAGRIVETAFWSPDPDNPANIVRTGRDPYDAGGMSEFPSLVVNQARVLDYFAEFMAIAPTRMKPDYGVEFLGLEIEDEAEYPVAVTLQYTAGEREGQQRTVRAKFVVGADGARSRVRHSIGRVMSGNEANHAWGVIDALAVTDFPDVRCESIIQSHGGGNILLIPREGGYMFRLYVDLGAVADGRATTIRSTPVEEIVKRANEILHPYTIDLRSVGWHSVYVVAQRLTDHFDDVDPEDRGSRVPRVFIAGDACHTHSAKAGLGMNVSIQDGFNLGWKLAHVLEGRSPAALLDTYSAERQMIAKNLIDFDQEYSALMASRKEDLPDPGYLEAFHAQTGEFMAGFMTPYTRSMLTSTAEHQDLARGYPIGRRFHSAMATRVCDANPLEIGHEALADGRWRLYVFADGAAPGEESPTTALAAWLAHSPDSPVVFSTPEGADMNARFDIKVIYQQEYTSVDIARVPEVFKPAVGPFGLRDYEYVFAATPDRDIFDEREIDRDGAIVVVRPDQYVAKVLPLTATTELSEFFRRVMPGHRVAAPGREAGAAASLVG